MAQPLKISEVLDNSRGDLVFSLNDIFVGLSIDHNDREAPVLLHLTGLPRQPLHQPLTSCIEMLINIDNEKDLNMT